MLQPVTNFRLEWQLYLGLLTAPQLMLSSPSVMHWACLTSRPSGSTRFQTTETSSMSAYIQTSHPWAEQSWTWSTSSSGKQLQLFMMTALVSFYFLFSDTKTFIARASSSIHLQSYSISIQFPVCMKKNYDSSPLHWVLVTKCWYQACTLFSTGTVQAQTHDREVECCLQLLTSTSSARGVLAVYRLPITDPSVAISVSAVLCSRACHAHNAVTVTQRTTTFVRPLLSQMSFNWDHTAEVIFFVLLPFVQIKCNLRYLFCLLYQRQETSAAAQSEASLANDYSRSCTDKNCAVTPALSITGEHDMDR